MAVGYDIGASASTSSGAQSGATSTGDLIVTGGGSGSLSSMFPKVPTTQAWIVYVAAAIVGLVALYFFARKRKR